MRTFAAITAGGVLSVVLFKLLAAVVFPVLGVLVGILMTGRKLVFFAGVAYLLYSLFFKKRRRERERA